MPICIRIQGLEAAAAFVESRYDFYDAKGCRRARPMAELIDGQIMV